MLTLFYSNRYEALTEALLEGLSDAPDPWVRESVIVPSAALRRRLELDIAKRQGICANLDFTYLAQWIWARIGAVIPVPEQSPFSPDRLAWRCYRLLDPAVSRGSARLDAYLSGADEAMRYELARRVATVLDHYLTYRPEWLTAWQQGRSIFERDSDAARINPRLLDASDTQRDDEHWQSALWRELLLEVSHTVSNRAVNGAMLTQPTQQPTQQKAAQDSSPETPPAYRFLAEARNLDLDTVARAAWPARVSVFALPTMPPLQVALLRELARWIDVRMYVFNPCREYWTDILPEAQVDALAMRGAADYHAVGNPLLAEWGRQTQAQLHMLQELTEGAAGREASYYERNEAGTLLAACQNAILELAPQPVLAPNADGLDAALEVHVCHSLSRQLEALHDRLLALFDAQADLQPGDVMVAVPDLAGAAPLIDAVFGTAAQRRRIPYRISGLPPSRVNPIACVLLDLLVAPIDGLAAADLIEWLRVDAIAERYAIDAAELETVQTWLTAAGARRGLAPDAGALPAADVPAPRHTLSDALLRLYLGYAMPDAADPVADCLPVPGAEGAQAELLGRLARFVDQVEHFARVSAQVHTPVQWAALLRDALDTLFSANLPFADSLAAVRDAIDQLAQVMSEGAAEVLLPTAVVRAALSATLDDPARGGVPWGGVTFSALTSLRGLPFRVICLLDLNDGALPSVTRADEFDLIAAFPKLGDRQRRDDERNLFLDLLLATRERMLIYYTGRSIRDNTALPPAAMVDELLDHLALATAGVAAGPDAVRRARAALITEHPLQPFAAQYALAQRGLYTFDPDRAQIAAALADGAPRLIAPFFNGPLPAVREDLPGTADTVKEIEFDDFERFWRHPARTLLRDRLGIALFDAQAALSDSEPFELDWDARNALADRVLPVLLDELDAGADAGAAAGETTRAARIARASPELPGGATGAVWRGRTLAGLSQLAGAVHGALGQASRRLPFALAINPVWPIDRPDPDDPFASDSLARLAPLYDARPLILSGVLRHVAAPGQVIYRYARPTARDYLSAWLSHLVLCACVAQGEPAVEPRTLWFGDAAAFELTRVAAPLERLAELLALYQVGLRTPLPFFPRSAWAQVGASEAEARTTWLGSQMSTGEVEDAYLKIALRGQADPGAALDAVFQRLAHIVFKPLIEHMREPDIT